MNIADCEDLVVLLEMLGNGEAAGPITLPSHAANRVVKFLLRLKGPRGRPPRTPLWLNGAPVRGRAREIATVTGEKESTIRRRLFEIKARRRRAK